MKKKSLIIINVFWYLIIAFLSYRMPLFMDDYFQSKSFATGESIKSVGMIFDSLKVSYQIFNGRVITMFFIQLMLALPRIIFSVVNALVYILLANLIVLYINAGNNQNGKEKIWQVLELALVYIALWFFMPDFAEVVIWPSGCITYMWMNLIILSFGFLYYRDFINVITKSDVDVEKEPIAKKILLVMVYFIFGVCAGWSAEASAGATIFGIMLYILWNIANKRMIAIEKWVGFVSCIIGYSMLVFAPANRVRVADAENVTVAKGFLATYAYRLARESYYLFIFLLIPIGVSVALYVYSSSGKAVDGKNILLKICKITAKGEEAFFWIIAFTSVYIMTFSAGFANRIFQYPLILLIIAMGKSLHSIVDKLEQEKKDRLIVAIKLFCVTMMVLALVEVTAGTLYSKMHDSFFDRQMIYYNIYDTQGIISENIGQN